ncbi:hypothetical protein DJ83_17215 [Halorubrum ezzemoulense]|uniref:Uncharacterized protein n=2 Tax=Halorubrum ezzemoulense TaxID=337243 RepID=A0A256IL71_HALEZ|nr:hypothetical protein DJ83_17215 [Halorubrum ezzemoulense]
MSTPMGIYRFELLQSILIERPDSIRRLASLHAGLEAVSERAELIGVSDEPPLHAVRSLNALDQRKVNADCGVEP